MNSDTRFPGDISLIFIGYKYKVLGFISTEGSGSNDPGDSCLYSPLALILMLPFYLLLVLACLGIISIPLM